MEILIPPESFLMLRVEPKRGPQKEIPNVKTSPMSICRGLNAGLNGRDTMARAGLLHCGASPIRCTAQVELDLSAALQVSVQLPWMPLKIHRRITMLTKSRISVETDSTAKSCLDSTHGLELLNTFNFKAGKNVLFC